MAIHGEGLGTGLPNDGDYADVELDVLSWLHTYRGPESLTDLAREEE